MLSLLSFFSYSSFRRGARSLINSVRVSAVVVFLLLLVLLNAIFYSTGRWDLVMTFVIGIGLGASLHWFHFGFSRSFRLLLVERKTLAMRAILWMLGLAITGFALLQANAMSWQAEALNGLVRPFGVANIIGALLFGIGMQLGIGCTSGTLNRAGQLQMLSLPTLVAMVVGGTFAVSQLDIWRDWPVFAHWSFSQSMAWPLAVVIQLGILGLLYRGLLGFEKTRNDKVESLISRGRLHRWGAAALALAVLNTLLFWVSGAPWSISAMFPYWGIHTLDWLETDLIDWPFWNYVSENQNHLNASSFENTVSVTTWGVVIGALCVTLLKAPKSDSNQSADVKAWGVSLVAGFIMGVGAILASGCNIGAFFSGIASGSLHGWLWLPFALIGNWIGIFLKSRIPL